MNYGTIQQTASVGGLSIQSTVNREAEGQIGQSIALPAAKTGTLSTRTSDTAGTLTLEADHGITDSDVINIFWLDADGVYHCAYGATVGTVSSGQKTVTSLAPVWAPSTPSTNVNSYFPSSSIIASAWRPPDNG